MARNPSQPAGAVLALALSFSALAAAPTMAAPSASAASFKAIEYALSDSDALSAEQALVARIAPESGSAEDAALALTKAGAHRVGADPSGDARFAYDTQEVLDDVLADVEVTVVVHEDGGVIRSAIVTRDVG